MCLLLLCEGTVPSSWSQGKNDNGNYSSQASDTIEAEKLGPDKANAMRCFHSITGKRAQKVALKREKNASTSSLHTLTELGQADTPPQTVINGCEEFLNKMINNRIPKAVRQIRGGKNSTSSREARMLKTYHQHLWLRNNTYCGPTSKHMSGIRTYASITKYLTHVNTDGNALLNFHLRLF